MTYAVSSIASGRALLPLGRTKIGSSNSSYRQKRTMRKEPLATKRKLTFLWAGRNLEVVVNTATKTFQPGKVIRQGKSSMLATCIGYGIESRKGKL